MKLDRNKSKDGTPLHTRLWVEDLRDPAYNNGDLLVEMGHHALAWRSTSLLAMGELWLKGKMDEREFGWLERQMVSRHPLG